MAEHQLQNLFTVKNFAKNFNFVTESSLRYLIFYSDTNGFDKVITRIGKKVLIDSLAFENWIEETNQKNIVKFN